MIMRNRQLSVVCGGTERQRDGETERSVPHLPVSRSLRLSVSPSLCLFILSLALLSPRAFAASGWFDDSFRRPIEVIWDAEHGSGSEVCHVVMYTGGHHNPDGSDIRVSTED